MRPAQILSLALLSSTVSAWQWDSWRDSTALREIEGIFRRADTSSSDSDSSTSAASSTGSTSNANDPTATFSSASSASDASSSGSSSSGSSSGSATTKASGSSGSSKSTSSSGSGSITKTSGSGSSSVTSVSSTSYNASVGYGGISMISPDPESSSSYYKIGNYITFAWNMTSLSITPTAIDILAACSANAETYTLALNQSVSATTMGVTWDTNEYQATATVPLLTETYTLIIHDAAIGPSATAAYGALSVYSQFYFAMYTKQAYTPLASGWTCVTCSGAMTSMERQTLSVVFGAVAVTVASFTWFAGNFGIF